MMCDCLALRDLHSILEGETIFHPTHIHSFLLFIVRKMCHSIAKSLIFLNVKKLTARLNLRVIAC